MPQEFYRSFQNNVEITDEKAGQMVDYTHPEYYQSSEVTSCGDVPSEYPAYNDYTHPSHYSVFPWGDSKAQEAYMPVAVEWNPGDEERGKTHQWRQEKVKRGRVRRLAGLGGLAITIGGWLLKLKGLAFLLKFGTAGITALISVAFYALAFGWKFAFGFVGLIFVHEMGHVIAVKAKGLPVKGMIFIPFFGAAVGWSNAKNIKDEAEVAIAGPLAGAIGAVICLAIVELFHLRDTVWLPLAYMGFFLNLLNLAPIWPLDGGRVFDAINRRVWIVGFVVLLGLQIWFWLQGNLSMWLLFLLILSGSRFLTHGQTAENGEETSHKEDGVSDNGVGTSNNGVGASPNPYYEVPIASRIALTLLYFALVVVLFVGMTMAHSYMGL